MMTDWIPCTPANQNYISSLKNCRNKPYLVTYKSLSGKRYVKKVNIYHGLIRGKVGGDVVAWMPLPKPYMEAWDDE